MTDAIAMTAGAICDDLDELLSQIDSSQVEALSHLYVARQWLLQYLERRPNQRVGTANAELAAVEDALERANDAMPAKSVQTDDSGIDELVNRVQGHREAIAASEDEFVGWEVRRFVEGSSSTPRDSLNNTESSMFEQWD